MSTDELFNKAAEDVKNLKTSPSNDSLLNIYALFKQSTVGDCNTAKPGIFDLKAKAKWESWNGLKGKSQEDSKKEYIKLVDSLISSIGLK